MFCGKCGCEIKDNEVFCKKCGAQIKSNSQVVSADVVAEEKAIDKPKKKKIFTKKFIWLTSIISLLVITLVTLVCLSFPLRVTMDSETKTKTVTGVIEDAKIVIKSNQPILKISYAMGTTERPKEEQYLTVKPKGSPFKKTLTLDELRVPPGDNKLYIYVKTLFGEYEDTIKFTCDIGSLVTPSPEDFVNISEDTQVVDHELLITFDNTVPEEDAIKAIESWGGEVIGSIHVLNLHQARFYDVSADELVEKAADIEKEKFVEAVSCNIVYQDAEISAMPNDSKYDKWNVDEPSGNNWHMECIDAPGAWEHNKKLQTVKVGVLDSTLYYDHEDIQMDPAKYLYLGTSSLPTVDSFNAALQEHSNSDCYVENCSPCGFYSHGTHVSGIIGAIANNKKGVCGTNWNAKLYFSNAWALEKYSDGDLSVSYCGTSNFLYSITYMAMSDCRVINMSLGDSDPSEPGELDEIQETNKYNTTFKNLEEAGYDCLVVKAAGNDTNDASRYRLNRVLKAGEYSSEHVIIVGAISHTSWNLTPFNLIPTQYSYASYSNYGDFVDIVAPGTNVYATVPVGYDYKTGTSMAAPMVSGVASMVYGANPKLTAPEVKEILVEQVKTYSAKGEKTYPVVNAKISVEYALGIKKNAAVEKPKAGFVTGVVRDAKTGEVLKNASVIIENTKTGERLIGQILPNGEYYLYAPKGTYTMEFRSEGYIDEIIHNVKIEEGIVKYNVLLNMVSSDSTAKGYASGTVINAFDASAIPNAKIVIYRGIDNTDGDAVKTLKSDEFGKYNVELAPGNYTLSVTATDYTPATATIIVVPDQHKGEQNCTMTPILKPGEMRIVLTWGMYPNDLDSHLVGPGADGGSFHTFYKAKNYIYNGTTYVNLDVDDTKSYGPETTSVYVGSKGKDYVFYVHDYSNKSSSYSNTLSTSGAVVKVYIAGVDTPYIFNAPTQDGTLWKVFKVKNGVLTPINTMSYEGNSSRVGQ